MLPADPMLLFKKRFHQGLVDGSITLTFRAWDKPRVKAGTRYRCHPIGVLVVDAIDRVPVAAITEAEARQAGFAGKDELVAYLEEVAPDATEREVWRVRLHHGGEDDRVDLALEADLEADDVAMIRERLRRLDERSPVGVWTARTLATIAAHPRIAASQLAAKLGRDKADFKADVVKLKKLGLTQSFEVGYALTPRGEAYRRLAGSSRATKTRAKRA